VGPELALFKDEPIGAKATQRRPARSSVPPAVSLVCALQATAAWPSTIGVPNRHWADYSSANTRAG
jgi:hypothetical protein